MKILNLVIIVMIMLSSCNNKKNEVNVHIKKIKEKFPIIEEDGWKIDNVLWEKDVKFYNFKKTISDTFYFLDFDFIINDSIYSILSYEMQFEDNKFIYRLNLDKNGDTLYFYKHPLIEDGDVFRIKKMVFYSGKYKFLYNAGRMKIGQRRYFEKYSDSLTKIKGDNLPPLPNLESKK